MKKLVVLFVFVSLFFLACENPKKHNQSHEEEQTQLEEKPEEVETLDIEEDPEEVEPADEVGY